MIRRVLNQTEAIATRLDETSARGAASMRRARAYRATLRRRLRSAVESERSQVWRNTHCDSTPPGVVVTIVLVFAGEPRRDDRG